MKIQNLLWAGVGFGTAVLAVTGLVLYLPIDGQDEDVEETEGTQLYSFTPSGSYFIRIEGIEGECKEDGHENWCEISSYSQSLISPSGNGSASGRTRSDGQTAVQTFTITKQVDKATPRIMEACVNGEEIIEIEMDFCNIGIDGNMHSYMKYILTDVVVESYRTGGSSETNDMNDVETHTEDPEYNTNISHVEISQDQNIRELDQYVVSGMQKRSTRPTEVFSFRYDQIKVVYTEMDDEGSSKGNIEYTWNVEDEEA